MNFKEFKIIYKELIEWWYREKNNDVKFLPKSILRKLIVLVDNCENQKLLKLKKVFEFYKNWGIERLTVDLTNPIFIIKKLQIEFFYRPNYKKQCDELYNIYFIKRNDYTLGYSIEKFIYEINGR